MVKVTLDKFKVREYQRPFFDAMEHPDGKYRNAIVLMPRRSGKDLMVFNYCISYALSKVCSVLYLLPTYSQAKIVIFDAIDSSGIPFLDYIPKQVVKAINSSELKITLINGSIIQLRGADNYDRSIVGTNASLIVFSEFAICDPRAYEYASPIVAANGGQMIFISTPRGRNHLYDLWKRAQKWPDWFCLKLTVDETKHVTPETLLKEQEEHSQEYMQQEWYCSFDRGIQGSFYADYITKMLADGRIGRVPYDPSLMVNTAWDLGFNDQTVILFYQLGKNNLVSVIDCYANTNQPLSHYIKYLRDKEYVYGNHFAPHDIEVHDYQTGMSRLEMARTLGLNFQTREVKGKLASATPRVSVADGIEKVWTSFSRISIDQSKCAKLIKALESYHRVWDDDKKVYKQEPLHDWSSDFADCFRYMCLTLHLNEQGMTEADARRGYQEALFSNSNALDYPFNEDRNIQQGRWF